jgi:hypothetical protein
MPCIAPDDQGLSALVPRMGFFNAFRFSFFLFALLLFAVLLFALLLFALLLFALLLFALLLFALLLFAFLQFDALGMSDNDWLYTEIENTRLTFERNTHRKPSIDIIERFNNLLQEDASSLSSRSSGSRSIRTRGRKLAIEIRNELGPEVLLLVVLVAKSLAKMAALSQESGLIHKLNEWWTAASHPSSLTKAASALIVGHPPSEISVRQELPVEAATTEQHAADALGTFIFVVLSWSKIKFR